MNERMWIVMVSPPWVDHDAYSAAAAFTTEERADAYVARHRARPDCRGWFWEVVEVVVDPV